MTTITRYCHAVANRALLLSVAPREKRGLKMTVGVYAVTVGSISTRRWLEDEEKTSCLVQGTENKNKKKDGTAYYRNGNSIRTPAEAVTHGLRYTKTIPSRSEQLRRLRAVGGASDEGRGFDVLIVGGGATGSGAALDAATRGLNAALIERGDFGSETSSRSTKLIWAGIRYIGTALSSLLRFRNLIHPVSALQHFWCEFNMVLGAQRERHLLLSNNPHLIKWVPIAIPFDTWISWPPPFGHPLFGSAPLLMPAVMKFYDAMSGFTCPPSHVMGRNRARRKFPQLDQSAKYFQVFYEGQHNDARTNTCLALTAAEEGAVAANYVEMVGLLREGEDGKSGRAIGARCRDNLTGEEFDVRARSIVFAGGPFTDTLRRMEDPDAKPVVAAAGGTHIVLPGYFCPGGIGMLDINTSDGRFLFFLPWEGHTLVGTTERKDGKPATSYHGPPEDDIQWLLREVKRYLSGDIKVRRADVLSAWQGYRPLARDLATVERGTASSRDHVISTHPETGVTFVTGGKWTTYREMARDAIDRVLSRDPELAESAGPCVTDRVPLRGGAGYNGNVPVRLVQEYGVGEETAGHLARTYGMNAFDVCRSAEPTHKRWPRFGNLLIEGFPYLECEVAYCCRHEMACTVSDILTLRMRLAYLNKDAAIAAAPRVAELMAKEMNWTAQETRRQLQEALDILETFAGPYPADAEESLSGGVTNPRALFRTLDYGRTGYIDLARFRDSCKALGLPFDSDQQAERTFDKIDRKRDGKIDEDEFLAWWENKSLWSSSDRLKRRLANKFQFGAGRDAGGGVESRGVAFG